MSAAGQVPTSVAAHTPGPWVAVDGRFVETDDFCIAGCFENEGAELAAANAARIVECVNGYDALRAQRDALAAALRQVEAHHRDLNRKADRPEERSYTLRVVRAALAAL